MRQRWLVVAAFGCGCGSHAPDPAAIHARVVAPVAGSYHVSKAYGTGEMRTSVHVGVLLAEDGTAKVTLSEFFLAYGSRILDDNHTFELRGDWHRTGGRIDVDVTFATACPAGLVEQPCTDIPDWAPTHWRLSCRAMVPEPTSVLPAPALVCEFADGEPVPRYTVVLDGVRVLVVGGPRSAIDYTDE